MAYCTKEQVADEFNGITFASTTNPTADTVDRWIAEADVLINSKVGLRYETPIAGTTNLILIRQIGIMLVSARVRRRLNRTGPDGETAKIKVTDTHDQAIKLLEQIVKGTLTLDDEDVLLNSKMGVSSANSPSDSCCTDADTDSPHFFRKNVDQW
jgi:uncharacterized protein DUF1320